MNDPGNYNVLLILPMDEVERAAVLETITGTIDEMDSLGLGETLQVEDAVIIRAPDEPTFTRLSAKLFKRLEIYQEP